MRSSLLELRCETEERGGRRAARELEGSGRGSVTSPQPLVADPTHVHTTLISWSLLKGCFH
ncbi:hypothetical protein J6590_003429 [Homalodisca vitripennis]|nr:hypothetical protein J6590_003429 [Homalodisca vitripennis]